MDTLAETLTKKAIKRFVPLALAKLNVDTIGQTLSIKNANGLFNALDYRLPKVLHPFTS